MDYEIKIFNEIDETLKVYWKDLESHSHNYCFQTYDWFENWVKNYKNNNENFNLRVVVIKAQAKILCILPFKIEKKYNLKILRWAGDSHLDFCSPILDKNFNLDKKTFTQLFKTVVSLIKNIDIVYLIRQP